MPANLTPQYHDAEERFKAAQTAADKMKALRQMLAVIPKHKGTEKLVAEIRRKLSRTQSEMEAERARGSGGRPSLGYVKHEGAGQVVLLGPPNCGKSSLLAALTNAHPRIADYPFTTLEPLSGMMDFEDVQVQLVDTPGISAEFMESWHPELVRNADRVLLMANLGVDTVLDEVETLLRRLTERRIRLVPLGNVGSGDEEPGTPGEAGDAADADRDGFERVEALAFGTQLDREGARDRLELVQPLLAELVGLRFAAGMHAASVVTGDGLEALRRALFDSLRVLRVYTKTPGHKQELHKPFVLPHGATVGDLAMLIHKDLAASMRFARLWGSSRFEGQPVHQDHVLHDRDIVEIHA